MWWVVLVLHLHLPHWDLVRWISFNCLVLPTRQCLDAYLCFVMLILWLVLSLTLHCSHLYWVPWIALNCFALHQVVFQREQSAKTNMLIWAQLQCNFQYNCNCIWGCIATQFYIDTVHYVQSTCGTLYFCSTLSTGEAHRICGHFSLDHYYFYFCAVLYISLNWSQTMENCWIEN